MHSQSSFKGTAQVLAKSEAATRAAHALAIVRIPSWLRSALKMAFGEGKKLSTYDDLINAKAHQLNIVVGGILELLSLVGIIDVTKKACEYRFPEKIDFKLPN